ncbi:MAG: DNA alkylation repair protein [Pirellulaceae bacterium]|nr:DNA alkylation repair protein [Pirellulaceae bacterium]
MVVTSSGSAKDVLRSLQEFAVPEKAAFFPKFFQAFAGGYGEGDRFLGVTVPNIRTVARRLDAARNGPT